MYFIISFYHCLAPFEDSMNVIGDLLRFISRKSVESSVTIFSRPVPSILSDYPVDLALCFLQRIRFNVSRVPIGWMKSNCLTGPENQCNCLMRSLWSSHICIYIYPASQKVQLTRSFVKDQVLLDLFVRLKFSHLPTSLALTTCYNHLSPGKLGPWRFTVLSR